MTTTREDGRSRIDQLPRQVAAACWPTPTASADKSIRTPEGARTEVARGKSPDLAAHVMSMWQTPVADDAVNRERGKFNSRGEPKLSAEVKLAQWPSPVAMDTIPRASMRPSRAATGRTTGYLSEAVVSYGAAHGATTAGSSATTEKPGALSPTFVAWLMGFPKAWMDCAPTSMPKRRKE